MAKRTAITSGKGEIILYRAPDGRAALDVRLEEDTLRLTQKQMAELFATDRSVITKHLRNIFKSGELYQISVCARFAHTCWQGSDKNAKRRKEKL